jgi:predicted flap endonuclease-1-like 5' DNA nuclease
MTFILLVIVVVAAALAAYIVGSRTRPVAPPVSASARSTPSPVPAIDPAADKPRAEDAFAAEKARIVRGLEGETALLRAEIAAREAPLAQLAEFTGERERLFRALADERTETARYRQVLVDIERNAPPPILAGVGEPDDLKLIVGVGPVLERMLHNLGITTFRQIARWTEHDVAEFDAKLPEFPGRIQRDQWVTQARALHESKYGQSVPGIRAG